MCLGLFYCFLSFGLIANVSVHRPYGTIFANEIFSSGVLLSECVYLSFPYFIALIYIPSAVSTDFRQFEYYLNVTGLDVRPTCPLPTILSFLFHQ
jgi:hypothetical protein